jgi:splicing factor 3B subunit 1
MMFFFHLQAACLATMFSTMRPDIDNMDEYVRNTTARAFAVVASALGIPWYKFDICKSYCKRKCAFLLDFC